MIDTKMNVVRFVRQRGEDCPTYSDSDCAVKYASLERNSSFHWSLLPVMLANWIVSFQHQTHFMFLCANSGRWKNFSFSDKFNIRHFTRTLWNKLLQIHFLTGMTEHMLQLIGLSHPVLTNWFQFTFTENQQAKSLCWVLVLHAIGGNFICWGDGGLHD